MECVHVGTRKLTRALAIVHRDLPGITHDRVITDVRLAFLRDQIVVRQIVLPFFWATAKIGNLTYRLNGHHSATLLAELAEAEFPKDGIVIFSSWVCDDSNDMATLYASFDARQSARTCGDIYRAIQGADDVFADVSTKHFALCAGALGVAHYGSYQGAWSHISPQDRAALAIGQPLFVHWVNEVLSNTDAGATERHAMRRIPVILPMFLTWSRSQRDAAQFWACVRDGTDPNPASPSRRLQRHLLSVTTLVGCGAKNGSRAEIPGLTIVRCLLAWNAFRRGEKTNLGARSLEWPTVA